MMGTIANTSNTTETMFNSNIQKHISIASLAAPKLHLYSIENNGENTYIYDASVIRLLSQVFRVPYNIITPSDDEGGRSLPGGNWTGMVGMVHRSEVHLASGIGINYARFQAVHFSYPYIFPDVTFMTDKPKSVPDNLAIIHPFPLILWILLIATIFLISSVLFLHVYRKQTYQNVLFMTFGCLLEKSIGMKLRKCSLKFIMGAWFIFVFVIINSYKAVLLSFLTLPQLTGIRNIADLAKAAELNSITCYSYKGTGLNQFLLESENYSWRSIGKCLQKNVINSENEEEAFIKAPPNKAFLGLRTYLRPYEDIYFISEDSFNNIMLAFSVSKKFRHQIYLNEKIHRLFAAGLFQKIYKDEQFIRKLKTPPFGSTEPGTLKILQFEDLKGAFIVLISGYVLSGIVLFIEIGVKRYLPKSNVTLQKKRRKILKKM